MKAGLILATVATVVIGAIVAAPMQFLHGTDKKGATTGDVKKEAGEAVDSGVEYAKETKEEFTTEIEKSLEQVEAKMKTLRNEAKDATAAAKVKIDRHLDELDAQRRKLKSDLAAFADKGDKAWSQVRSGMIKAMNEIKAALNKATDELERSEKSDKKSDKGSDKEE